MRSAISPEGRTKGNWSPLCACSRRLALSWLPFLAVSNEKSSILKIYFSKARQPAAFLNPAKVDESQKTKKLG